MIQIFNFPWQVCKALAHFASKDACRVALQCVAMEIQENRLIFCATDGTRLIGMVYYDAEYIFAGDEPLKVAIPLVFIKEMGEAKLGTKLENAVLTVELLDEDTGQCQLELEALHKQMSWRARSSDELFPNWRAICDASVQLRRGSGALNADLMADISKVWKTLGEFGVPSVATYCTDDASAVYVRFLKDDRLFALVMPLRVDEELFPVVSWPDWACGEPGVGFNFDKPEDDAAGGDDDLDPLISQATELLVRTQRASTASLQRHLRIGYNRAARLQEQLEQAGIVGPDNGATPREVLVTEVPADDSDEGGES